MAEAGCVVDVGAAEVVAVVTAGLIDGEGVVGCEEAVVFGGVVEVVVVVPAQPEMSRIATMSNTSGISNFFNSLLSNHGNYTYHLTVVFW
jgi:hypothetical protein